jgi:hypothetical protein
VAPLKSGARHMDIRQLKKMRRYRRLFRFMGFIWTLVGGMLLFSFVPLVLDPNASIMYNGVRTTDFGAKLSATLFAGAFVVAGLCFLFVPARMLDRLFIWRQSALSVLFFWRR